MTTQSSAAATTTLEGIIASEGMAQGRAYILTPPTLEIPYQKIEKKRVNTEINRLARAIIKTRRETEKLLENSAIGDDLQAIFEAQLLLLEDPTLIEEIQEKISSRRINAEWALAGKIAILKSFLLKSKDAIFRERAVDLDDIGNRILANLMDIPNGDAISGQLELIKSQTILLAQDIAPSLILRLPLKKVIGIVLEKGGISSHTSILARNYKLPLLVNVQKLLEKVPDGSSLLLDAVGGRLYTDPDTKRLKIYLEYCRDLSREQRKKWKFHSPVHSQDGSAVEIWANLSEAGTESRSTLQGTSGIGLFRTEFLYLKDQNLIRSYSEQTSIYRAILENFSGMVVQLRLLDVGDDKPMPRQMNERETPLRGARFLLANEWIVEAQLKAILTAAIQTNTPDGNCRFIIPMISTIEEISSIKAILKRVQESLALQLMQHPPRTPLGIMVETPAASAMVGTLSRHVDFLSIGSNDLALLSLAMEREGVTNREELYYQPSLFRQLHQIISQATVPLSLCGEIASQLELLPILLGLGLRSISISVRAIAPCASLIQNIKMDHCQKLAMQALKAETIADIKKSIMLSKDA